MRKVKIVSLGSPNYSCFDPDMATSIAIGKVINGDVPPTSIITPPSIFCQLLSSKTSGPSASDASLQCMLNPIRRQTLHVMQKQHRPSPNPKVGISKRQAVNRFELDAIVLRFRTLALEND